MKRVPIELLHLVVGIASIFLSAADRPSAVRASQSGVGYICTSTPGPFWTMSECNCPVPTVEQDFCSSRMPIDGDANIEFRYCDTADSTFTCTILHLSCGTQVWRCENADCNSETDPVPSTWGCVLTGKPKKYCEGFTYSWCDPVEYL